MMRRSYYIINGITLYRVFAAPVLFWLIYQGKLDVFKWLLGISFLTDAIDGNLARRFHVTSVFGTRIDSIGDDLTVFAAMTGMFVFRLDFIEHEWLILSVLFVLFICQSVYAISRYHKTTSFHTYLAKISAVLQGVFLILSFFYSPNRLLFYLAALITAIELLEEIVLVKILPHWETNVKGLYWVMKRKPLNSDRIE